MKVLDEAYVPTGTSGDNLATMVSHVIGSHQISFREEELPIEGMMPEHLTNDLRNLADNKNPNLDKTDIVNLGDDESVRENPSQYPFDSNIKGKIGRAAQTIHQCVYLVL